ncbi:MAG: hypothetical protein N4J56_004628 [Chroococcidiopsis sp. SAG 2025]|nr:hypothetical protein [Chroococcidiopsis sp. SAG 2025]
MLHEVQTIEAFGYSATEYNYEPETIDDEDVFESEVQYLSVDPDDCQPGLRIVLTLVNIATNATLNVDVLTTSGTL